ncbi:ORC-CDC6 family AAA ATPase [Leisingera sp. ANG-Vp]|uniref:ORC-CDC6 family AAA ATPase n=1 Tax=Leisingera sp. ANG-Vp TaxID=1577896 RepID=UPI00057D6157|nr:hypothetical protein [Leisingera sp. ANG-Vp]KIC15011.1 hypothetical protein RA20_19140 [Leisingera sp. ANG-Vp]
MMQNPFDTPKASHFTADEILDLYVDAEGDNEELVNGLLEPTSTTPLRLLGGKGSGKTHLLRYCSHSVRRRKYKGDLVSAIKSDGYIGLYVDSGALNAQKFFGKRLEREQWQSIFGYYFEMWLVHHFLAVMKQLSDQVDGEQFFDTGVFLSSVRGCFDVDVSEKFQNIDEFSDYLTALRKDVDYRSNNAALRNTFEDLEILFSPGRLIFGTAEAFRSACPDIKGATVCYMIDEVENFSELQQTFFNSLMRFREGHVTFKVGARLYGILTNDTMNEGEPIKRGSEFVEVHLDDHLRDLGEAAYRNFATKLIAKRLNQSGINCSTEREQNLSQEFESVDPANDYAAECLKILGSTDKGGRERPYFKKLRSTLSNKTNITPNAIDDIIEGLKCENHPLVEKASVLLFFRGAKRETNDAIAAAQEISESARAYTSGDKAKGGKHVRVLDYYKSDLLAQLYREARQPVAYCGFDTIVTLSQGIPRNLLMLLKHIYRRSSFAGENPFEGGVISKESQTDGIKDGAQWFWEDAQPEVNAASVRLSVEAIARLFRTVRYSAKPSEPALSAFSIRESELTENARKTLRTAENWSYLIHIPHSGSDKNTEERRYKYQLVPMLAPKWDVSYARRGTIELDDDFSNALFDEERRENLGVLFKKRTNPMLESGIFKVDANQGTLL